MNEYLVWNESSLDWTLMNPLDAPDSGFADAPEAGYYPELVDQGGLARALRSIAQDRQLDLGELRVGSNVGLGVYRTAETGSTRGLIRVSTVLNRRAFSISLDSARGHFVWANGSTSNLLEVAGVIDAWRGGILLAVLSNRFPFMEYPKISQGYEDGTPVPTQWQILIESEESYIVNRPLLLAAHENPRLSELFPFFSHGVLRLQMDCFDRSAGSIKLNQLSNGNYRVETTVLSENMVEVPSMEEAVAAAVGFLS